MAQTVVGLFDNSSEANQAVEKLVSRGISRDRIDISGQSASASSSTSGSSYSSTGSTSDSDEHESGISKFFKNLFGDDDDDNAGKYSHVASRAQCIVTVHAQSRDEAEDAADILDDNGAVNVDERASEYGYSGSGSTSGGSGSSMSGGSGSYGTTGSGTSGGFGDTSGTVGAFDTGTAAGVSGTASMAGDVTSGAGTTGVGGSSAGYGDLDSDRTKNLGTTGNTSTSNNESQKLKVVEENLEVGKREVERGGVRLRSRIVERPVEESVRLREERVNVERTSVDRPANESDFANFQERDIEMVERAEVPVVNKTARVVEEVSLNKEVEERNETVRDTVRKTEVDVENLDKNDTRNTTNNNNNNNNL